ncbi:MAG: pilus assembly protein PilM [Candidatus Acidiferrales bacterium]
MSSATSFGSQFYQLGAVRRLERWLNAMPHPSLVVEIGATHVAAAHWGASHGSLEAFASEPLPFGAVVPSPVETNIAQPDAVRSALRRVFNRVPARTPGLALLIPDQVVRVFILPFETLPRRADESLPLLRWRLKKSVPFDMDETVVSWMRQSGREGNLEVVTAVARQRIVREYEEAVSGAGANSGVVLSSTLATLPLLEDRGATLLIRMSGKALTTVIVHGSNLCVYRSTDMSADAALLEPQAVLDEIFPAIAYYQDTWGGMIDRARISGFGAREEIFRHPLAEELKCPVASIGEGEGALQFGSHAKDLIHQDLEALVGWMMNGGS